MKSILISIRPEWLEKILNGEKTIEIRKTKPKCELPIKVYIYCTKQGRPLVFGSPNGYVEERFTRTYNRSKEDADKIFGNLQGKVVAEFILNKIEQIDIANILIKGNVTNDFKSFIETIYKPTQQQLNFSCLTLEELENYGKNAYKTLLYAWHMKNLIIYDEPKELNKFDLKNAPRSWQYIKK